MSFSLAPGSTVRVSTPAVPVIRVDPPGAVVTAVPVAGPPGPAGPPGSQGPTGPAGGTGFHHVQIAASETWTITHGLGYYPGGIMAKDSAGDPIEYANVMYVNYNTLQLTFPGFPVSGSACIS